MQHIFDILTRLQEVLPAPELKHHHVYLNKTSGKLTFGLWVGDAYAGYEVDGFKDLPEDISAFVDSLVDIARKEVFHAKALTSVDEDRSLPQ